MHPCCCDYKLQDGIMGQMFRCWLHCSFLADGYGHQLCEAETPQDPHAPDFKPMNKGKGNCKAIISGLLCGKPVKWEVCFDIEPYLKGREREEKVHEDLWNETFHHLAARSIIQDFEQMADKECEIEHGKYRVWSNLLDSVRPVL